MIGPKVSQDTKNMQYFFGNQGPFQAKNQYLITLIGVKKERKGFLHVLLIPISDNSWVIVNSRLFHLSQMAGNG